MLVEPESRSFGTELRRRRLAAGYSLTDLGRLVHYSRGHLSKVETGSKPPSTDLARRCDAILGGDGLLTQLGAPRVSDRTARAGTGPEQVWVLELGAHGHRRLLMMTRRELLATGVLGGAAGIIGTGGTTGRATRPGTAHAAVTTADDSPLATFRSWFPQLRDLGQRIGPELLMPILVAHTDTLSQLAGRYRGADQTQALLLAARYSEYAGWMAQESGSNGDAAWWTDRAVEFAAAAGDHEMSAYGLVRRALIAMYQRDAAGTVALAQAARAADCRPRIRGLAAQREAQGHALAGDHSACLAALDRAGTLVAADPVVDKELVIGSSHVADPVLAATGWSLFELGRPLRAAQVLSEVVHGISPQALRARARYGARLALALASDGRLEEACAQTDQVLDAYLHVRSATIGADLRALDRTLRRWPTEPTVQRTRLRLTEALRLTPTRADHLT